ncbi:MarR family transcriptional regulator [Bifidobacterium pullorum]
MNESPSSSAPATPVAEPADETPLGVLLRRLNNMTARYLGATMPEEAREATGGNAEIILYLVRHEDREMFPQDIERRFGITRSTSSRVLGLMEKKGLIRRESVARDARLKRIVLTDKARDIERLLHGSGDRMETTMTAGIAGADLAVFRRCLDAMMDNLAATGKVGRCGRPASGGTAPGRGND